MLYNLYIDYIDYIDVIPLKFRSQNDFEPFKLNTADLLLWAHPVSATKQPAKHHNPQPLQPALPAAAVALRRGAFRHRFRPGESIKLSSAGFFPTIRVCPWGIAAYPNLWHF